MKSHNEFMKDVDHAKSLPVQVGKYVNEEQQSPSDINSIKNQIGDGKNNQENRNTSGSNVKVINKTPGIGGTDKTGSLDNSSDALYTEGVKDE